MSALKKKITETHRLTSKRSGQVAADIFKERKRHWSASEIEPIEFDNSFTAGDLILSGSYGQVFSFERND